MSLAHQLSRADVMDVATVEQQIELHAKDYELVDQIQSIRKGEILSTMRDLFVYKRDEGGFEGYIDRRLNLSKRAAYEHIQIYEGLDGISAPWRTLTHKAKIEAATAEPDIKAIIAERVAAGEVFTAAQVKDIKARAAQEAINQINTDAMQAREELEALRKSLDAKDIKSASDTRDLQQQIETLTSRVKGFEEEAEKYRKALPKPAKAKEQAAETGGVVLGSDGKFHSGSSVEQKRMHDAFMFAFDKALDLTENPPLPDRVAAGCPAGDRARLRELCAGAADYFTKIKEALNDQ